jgi:hypothetical protein
MNNTLQPINNSALAKLGGEPQMGLPTGINPSFGSAGMSMGPPNMNIGSAGMNTSALTMGSLNANNPTEQHLNQQQTEVPIVNTQNGISQQTGGGKKHKKYKLVNDNFFF